MAECMTALHVLGLLSVQCPGGWISACPTHAMKPWQHSLIVTVCHHSVLVDALPPEYNPQDQGYPPQGYPPDKPAGYPPSAQPGYPGYPAQPGYVPTQPVYPPPGYPLQAYPPQGAQQQVNPIKKPPKIKIKTPPTHQNYLLYFSSVEGEAL